MQQIYRQSDQQFEVFTTVFSPQACRSRSRRRHVEAEKNKGGVGMSVWGVGRRLREGDAALLRAVLPSDQQAVVVMPYRSRWSKELDLEQGELVQVLFKEDQSWWFGRLGNGHEGYFPAACVEPLACSTGSTGSAGSTRLSEGGVMSRATPTLLRRGSVPVVVTGGAPCGCTSGRSTPKLLRKDSIRRALGHDGSPEARGTSAVPPHSSPSLLHRVLTKSRRKSCPHLPHPSPEIGSINSAFQPD